MDKNIYNPYNMEQKNIDRQNYYGPGYYQHQPNPITYNNMPNIGSGGYNPNIGSMGVTGQYGNINSGYYNNNMPGGQYYNPYLEQKKRERELEQTRKNQQHQSNIMKKLSKNSHKIMGVYDEDKFQDHAKKYDSSLANMTNEQYLEYNEQEQLARVHEISMNQTNNVVYDNRGIDKVNTDIERTNKKFGITDDMSMMEYFDVAGDILLEQKIEETKRNKRNVGGLYNSEGYGKLIDIHSGNHNYFNSINRSNNLGRLKHHNIDDMEVTLPNNMSEQYTKRKADFINQLLNGK